MDVYDILAPHYRQYAAARSAYLAAVDRMVLANAPAAARSLLDVGAGDGVRGMSIARNLGIDHVVLCDASKEMSARCLELAPSEVWHRRAEDIPDSPLRFDVILCLWNVLGHIGSAERRVRALARMRRLLAPGGAVFLDVNNRHNAAAYGKLKVLGRVITDAVHPKECRGDSSFEWHVGGQRIPAMGHLFTAHEVASLIARAGLTVTKRSAVDYVSGATSRWFFRGQLVYMLTAAIH
jgi:SAM-dependent methyltransferase